MEDFQILHTVCTSERVVSSSSNETLAALVHSEERCGKKDRARFEWKLNPQTDRVVARDYDEQGKAIPNNPNEHMNKCQHNLNEKTVARNETPKLEETKHFYNFNYFCCLQRFVE
eukprot:2717677-Amphidinium_carterae.1